LLFAAREDCERLQTIVDDLLNLSRLESGRIDLHKRRVEPQSLVDLAVDVHGAAAKSQQITLRSEVFPGLPEAFADPDRLQLVFTNLISNALRYSPAGSEIVVRAIAEAAPGDGPTERRTAKISSVSKSSTKALEFRSNIKMPSSKSSSTFRAVLAVAPDSASSSRTGSYKPMVVALA
jgi:signal transduction histidine kinase